MIWVIYAYNVMFNLGTGMENATHLKNMIYLSMVLLSVGQHLSHWPTIRTLSPVCGKLLAELALKFSDVNHLFRSFDFLEKHLYFFIRYLMGISKYSQNATRQYQTLFYFILLNHHIR